jgi:hypothetical protein
MRRWRSRTRRGSWPWVARSGTSGTRRCRVVDPLTGERLLEHGGAVRAVQWPSPGMHGRLRRHAMWIPHVGEGDRARHGGQGGDGQPAQCAPCRYRQSAALRTPAPYAGLGRSSVPSMTSVVVPMESGVPLPHGIAAVDGHDPRRTTNSCRSANPSRAGARRSRDPAKRASRVRELPRTCRDQARDTGTYAIAYQAPRPAIKRLGARVRPARKLLVRNYERPPPAATERRERTKGRAGGWSARSRAPWARGGETGGREPGQDPAASRRTEVGSAVAFGPLPPPLLEPVDERHPAATGAARGGAPHDAEVG